MKTVLKIFNLRKSYNETENALNKNISSKGYYCSRYCYFMYMINTRINISHCYNFRKKAVSRRIYNSKLCNFQFFFSTCNVEKNYQYVTPDYFTMTSL